MCLRRLRFLALAPLLAPAMGCERLYAPPPLPPQEIIVRVSASDGAPLEGVLVRTGQRTSARTDGQGMARLHVEGEEGTKVDLAVACPPGYAAPSSISKVVVRRTSRPPQLDVPCRPLEHAVLIAFKTSGATGLPIVYLGRELARTDAAGYALVELEPKAGETLTFTLDTSAPEHRYLRPQNPEVNVQVPDVDEAFAIEQKFTVERPQIKKFVAPIPTALRKKE